MLLIKLEPTYLTTGSKLAPDLNESNRNVTLSNEYFNPTWFRIYLTIKVEQIHRVAEVQKNFDRVVSITTCSNDPTGNALELQVFKTSTDNQLPAAGPIVWTDEKFTLVFWNIPRPLSVSNLDKKVPNYGCWWHLFVSKLYAKKCNCLNNSLLKWPEDPNIFLKWPKDANDGHFGIWVTEETAYTIKITQNFVISKTSQNLCHFLGHFSDHIFFATAKKSSPMAEFCYIWAHCPHCLAS